MARLIGFVVCDAVAVFIDRILAANEILKIARAHFRRVFKKHLRHLAVPVEVLGDIYSRDREGKRLRTLVALGHDLVKRLVDAVHLRLKGAVGHIC